MLSQDEKELTKLLGDPQFPKKHRYPGAFGEPVVVVECDDDKAEADRLAALVIKEGYKDAQVLDSES